MELNVGKTRIVSLVEQTIAGLEMLIKEANPESLNAIDWLKPHYVNDEDKCTGLIQSFVISTGNQTIVVDTCVGDDRERPYEPGWHLQQRGFLNTFVAQGFDPAQVDLVLCTHLHVDHVGWNTQLVDGQFVPTFPNARYLFERREFEHWQNLAATVEPEPAENESRKDAALRNFRETQRLTWGDSVQPIVDAGLIELVDVTEELSIADGISLVPTPGHTIGHVSVRVTDGADQVVISGDCVHHPCQIAHPPWRTLVDFDPVQAGQTRQELFTQLVQSGGRLVGSHFSKPCCGHLQADGDGFRFLPDGTD